MLLSWCGWHIQVLCNFYKNVNISMLWSISRHGGMKRVPRRRNRNGATATYPKMMPRQHIGSGSSWRYRCKGSVAGACKRWWGDPGYRVPTGRRRWQGKRGATCTDNSGTEQARASQTTCIHSRKVVSAVIPSKRANGTVQVLCNVEEVDVLSTVVVEVVVHGP